MNRVFKKVLFILFYIALIGVVVFGVYQLLIKPAPTCDDGILNQNEEKIDCGGPCVPCSVANLSPIQASENIQIFPAADNRTTVFSEIININETHGASIDYVLRIFNSSGEVVNEIFNSSYIFPSDSIFIHEIVQNSVGEIEIEILETRWIDRGDLPISKPQITDLSTGFEGSEIVVEGTIENTGVNAVGEIKIIGLFRDQLGFNNLLSSQTVVSNLGSLDERNFTLSAPITQNLEERIALNETRIFITVND